MRPSLALLDLAGTTLAVTDEVGTDLRDVLASAGVAAPAEAIAASRGRHKRNAIRDLIAYAAPGSPVPDPMVERLHAEFRRRLLSRYETRSPAPIPGAEPAMRWLTRRGVAVVLTTGFDRTLAEAMLAPLRWEPPLVAGDELPRGRPAPT